MAGPNQNQNGKNVKTPPVKKKTNEQNTNANSQNKNNDEQTQASKETQPSSSSPTMHELMMLMQQTIAKMSEMFADNQLLHQEVLNLSRENKDLKMDLNDLSRQDTRLSSTTKDAQVRGFKAKPKRPSIEYQMEDLEWQIFEDAWKRYKSLAILEDEEEICLELRECCSSEVNKMLYEFKGATVLNDPHLDEGSLLEYIKSVAVKTQHVEIHRKHFHSKVQDQSEPISKFVGRLKAQAALCNFTAKCSSCTNGKVSYTEEMISQRLIAGLANQEHQAKILSEAEELATLEMKIKRLISLETSDDTTTLIRAPTSATSIQAPFKSSYKKSKKQTNQSDAPNRRGNDDNNRKDKGNRFVKRRKLRCRGCGQTHHGEGKSLSRKDCPAFREECWECNKIGHFGKVCEKRSQANYVRASGETSAESSSEDEADNDYNDDEIEVSQCVPINSLDFRMGQFLKPAE